MEMPSQEEQLIAEEYVMERPLDRPDTDVKKAVKSVVIYTLSCLIVGISMLCLFSHFGVFAHLPEGLIRFRGWYSGWFNVLFVLSVYVLVGLCCLRMAVIGCIRLYQHYAPEDIRRRCLFKPTCSEYAILAIKKYGLIIGGIKTWKRLFKKCRGNIYSIDYP